MQRRIAAGSDGDGFIAALPHQLAELFLFIDFLLEHGKYLALQADLFHRIPIVFEAVFAGRIVNHQVLVGVADFEVAPDQRQHVIAGSDPRPLLSV